MTTYVVSYKSEDGMRWYAAQGGGVTMFWRDVRRFDSADAAGDVAATMSKEWRVVEVQTGHDDGKPFVFRTLPATAA